MSKRSAETQMIKGDMSTGFSFGAGSSGGNPEDSQDPSKMASSDVLSTRKFAPMRRRPGGRGGARSGGTNLPNVFAGAIGPGVVFGGVSNGSASPSPAPSFGGGFGTPTPPVQTSFGNGGFSFGQSQQEQPKSNPFASLTPAPAQTNGTSGGMFGNASSSFGGAQQSNGMFENVNGNAANTSQSFGGFGTTNNDKPATSGFSFGGSTATAPATGGMFGAPATTSAPFAFGPTREEPKPASTSFNFGQTSTTSATTEPPKSATSGFTYSSNASFGAPSTTPSTTGFGSGLATDAVDGSKPTTGLIFGAPADVNPVESTMFRKPAEQPAQATSGFFSQKSPEPPSAGSLFGKPAEPSKPLLGFGATTNNEPEKNEAPKSFFGAPTTEKKEEAPKPLFGVPSGKTESAPVFGGFGNTNNLNKDEMPKSFFSAGKKDLAPTSFFGDPASEKKDEPSNPVFGSASEKKDKPLFGAPAPTEKKDDPPKSFFGSAPGKKDTPLFGAPAPTEKKDEPKSFFGSAPSTSGGFSLGAPKPAEQSAPKLDFSNPSFGPPKDAQPTKPPKPVSFPASPFGFDPPTNPTFTTAPTISPALSAPAPNSASSSNALTSSAGLTPRMRSPPLPADANQWSANQLTDYYNLFAWRSLNHSFKEALSKQDVFANLTPLCEAYIKEIANIRDLMARNQRYSFGGKSSLGASVPSKRTGEDNDERGAKRRTFGEESKANSTPSKSSSAQALASVLGGGLGSTDKKPPKSSGSIFDNPSASASTSWVNPFQKEDASNLPDDPEPTTDDESAPPPKRTGGLFDRITPPKDVPAPEPKRTGGLFDRITPPKDNYAPANAAEGMPSNGGDQTWNPEKGLKFSAPSNTSTNLFGSTNNAALSTGFTFSKPSSTATPSVATSTEVSESEKENGNSAADGEPSDAQPPPKSETDLSKQGPGEEDESSMFQVRAIVYDTTGGGYKKEGVGTLRVLKNKTNGRGRVIVRSDIGKVVLNVRLQVEMEYSLREKRLLLVPEFQAGGKLKIWGIRLGKEDVAEELRKVVEEVKKGT